LEYHRPEIVSSSCAHAPARGWRPHRSTGPMAQSSSGTSCMTLRRVTPGPSSSRSPSVGWPTSTVTLGIARSMFG
jgi:hypothetical protein